jgi:hypothetical protein
VSTLFTAQLGRAAAQKVTGTRKSYAGVVDVNLDSPPARRLIATLARHKVAVTPTLSVSLMPMAGEQNADRIYRGWADIPAGWRSYWKDSYWSFLQPIGWKPADYRTTERGQSEVPADGGAAGGGGCPPLSPGPIRPRRGCCPARD